MKSDKDIERNVEAELRWSPELDEKGIVVTVTGGVATLTGFVRTYIEKARAGAAAKRVAGVVGIANDIQVSALAGDTTDTDIASEAVAALRAELPFLHSRIKPVVSRGRVTLEGELEWNYQRDMATAAVQHIPGVIDVNNHIVLRPRAMPAQVKHLIEDAFRRSAEVDAQRISVEAEGGVVTLRGRVPSWSEREEAQRTAWSAPGVTQVRNEIVVSVLPTGG
jgi:osmotically-inducible protein OsmY